MSPSDKPKSPAGNSSTSSKNYNMRSSSNDDLMSSLTEFRKEFSDSYKKLSQTQISQFKELKNDMSQFTKIIAELRAVNSQLRDEVDCLKEKVSILESLGAPTSTSLVVAQAVQESFERERCSSNLIVYGITESSSSSAPQRVADDKSSFEKITSTVIGSLPLSSKLVRLGKAGSNDNCPLKLLLGSKENAANILSTFADAKRSGTSFPPGFRIVKDKTALQRTLLRNCHSELDQRTQAGEVGLRIVYVDGIPKVSLN
jgi:hypothetical protein